MTSAPAVNLSTVTPPPPAIEMPEIDTTTPSASDIVRFTAIDLPKWGQWLAERLHIIYPQITPRNYMGFVTHHSSSNSSLFLRGKRSVILATRTLDGVNPRPVVDIRFCFKFHPDSEKENEEVRILVSRVESWAASQGAEGVRVLDENCFDVKPNKVKTLFTGEPRQVLYKALGK